MSRNLFEYGHVPIYDPYQYNNDYQVGKLLNRVTRLKSQGRRLGLVYHEFTGRLLKIKQQFILRLSRILSGVFNQEEVHLAWITLKEGSHIVDFHQQLSSTVFDIWLSNEDTKEHKHLSELLSVNSTSESSLKYINNDFLPVLSRIEHSKTLLFAFDLQLDNDDEFYEYIAEFQNHLSKYVLERNIFFFVLRKNTSDSARLIYLDSPKTQDQRFFQSKKNHKKDSVHRGIEKNITWLKPLSMLSHPANNEMIEFIASHYDSLDANLRELNKINVIEFLKDSGVSINNSFDKIINSTKNIVDLKHEHLMLMGLSGTGLDNKYRLAEFAKIHTSNKSNWDSLDSYFQSHGSTALGYGIINEKQLCEWHIDSILEASEEDGFMKNPMQVRSMMDYTGQILLSSQRELSDSNKKHFIKLLESVSDRYSLYIRNQPELNSGILLEASRYHYKVGHVYDRLFNKKRYHVIDNNRIKSYESAAAVLVMPSVEDKLYASIAYRKGTSLNKVNKVIAHKHYVTTSNALYNLIKQRESGGFGSISHSYQAAEELAIYAIKSGIEKNKNALDRKVGNIVDNLLYRTGAQISKHEFYSLVMNASTLGFRNIQMHISDPSNEIDIFCNKSDFHNALIISNDIFSETYQVPTIRIVNESLGASYVHTETSFKILIGAPDTSDGIGEIVVGLDSILDQTYHIRMNIDFGEPVFIDKDGQKTLILSGSGINGILKAWSKSYLKFKNYLYQKETLMEELIIGKLLLAMLKRMGHKITDLLFKKAATKLSKKEETSIDELIEKINSSEGHINKGEVKVILEDLPPFSKNRILSSFQEEKKSIGIILDGIIHDLDIDIEAEQLLYYAKTLWLFVNDVDKSKLTINQSKTLNEYIKGFNLRYDEVDNVIQKYNTQGSLDKEKLANERSLLHHQVNSFKKFLIPLI
jgi:hypothetical protein